MGRVSPRLAEAARRAAQAPAGAEPVHLHLILRSELTPDERIDAANRVTGVAGTAEVELLPDAGIVLLTAPLGAVSKMAELSEVEWIDFDSTVPIEHLLDR